MRLAIAVVALLTVSWSPRGPRDLDVAIPPGSPTSWARRFPAITPGPRLFPTTPGQAEGGAPPVRTVTAKRTVETDVGIASAFGVVRILTWDLTGHLSWVDAPATGAAPGPVTGVSSSEARAPRAGDALYWTVTASLLRLLLHDQIVSEPELIAHLVEIGEPVLGMAEAARSEKAIEAVCLDLIHRIGAPRLGAHPLPAKSPRERMLHRFVVEELVAAHPYDPEGAFGQRLFLFADDVEPILEKYTRHHDSFVRRNAVAAWGRYRSSRTSAALGRLAGETDDDVVLMRALSAIGDGGSPAAARPLHRRLIDTEDPVERVALIEALGRVGATTAVPTLLELGDRALPDDPNLLQAVVAALTRMHASQPGVRKLIDRVHAMAVGTPQAFRFERDHASIAADFPDGPQAKGRILEQLTLLWMVRTDPANTSTATRLLGLMEARGRTEPVPRGAGVATNRALRGVSPAARFLFLETLRQLGDPGAETLERLSLDEDLEAVLRGFALGWLPPDRRGQAAVAVLEALGSSPEMKAYALEVLSADDHPRLEELGRREVTACLTIGREGTLSSEARYLVLTALRLLGGRDVLDSSDLVPLLELLSVPRALHGTIHERVQRMVDALVAEAAAGMRRSAWRERVDEILDLVVRHHLNARVTDATRADVRKRVEGQVSGLKGHREDRRYHDLVAVAIVEELLGVAPPSFDERSRGEFSPVVLLEEEILFALGRERSIASVRALVEFLKDHPHSQYRAQICLALGVTGDVSVARHLVLELLAPDGFVRFCAYESLRRLTGQDHWCDWMYGTSREQTVAAEGYYRWVRSR